MTILYEQAHEETPLDEDGQPILKRYERHRDYAVMTNNRGWVLVVDITKRDDLRMVAKIKLPDLQQEPAQQGDPPPDPEPTTASAITIDRENRQLIVSGSDHGLYIVDFDGPLPNLEIPLTDGSFVDNDGDGEDDRVMERIAVLDEQGKPIRVNKPALLWPELGLAWIGGLFNLDSPGLTSLNGFSIGPPELRIFGQQEGTLLALDQIAPFGVPTGTRRFGNQQFELPGLIQVQASLPAFLVADSETGEVEVDLVALGPAGLEIRGAGDPVATAKLPPTSFHTAGSIPETEALVLRRQAKHPWEEGYNLFVSDPVVT
ncbi:MAG: hypothetical protein GY842_06585, partial [bacterium]|nr:hypothetical protein [bacterium]